DPVRLPSFLEPLQARIVAHVLDEQIAAAAERPERELEEPLCEVHVRAFEPAGGRGREAAALTEIDGHVPAGGELADALDRGVERVRERELGDRLADDADDRLGAA